jgi:hypothetical protein
MSVYNKAGNARSEGGALLQNRNGEVITPSVSIQGLFNTLLPSNAAQDAGSLASPWQNGYFSGQLSSSNVTTTTLFAQTVNAGSIIGPIVPAGNFLPVTNNLYDVGSSTTKWKDIYYAGTAFGGGLSLTAQALTHEIIPATSATYNIGSNAARYQDIFWNGTATGGALVLSAQATTADIIPATTATYNIGSSGTRYTNIYWSGTATGGGLSLSAQATTADVIPSASATYAVGSSAATYNAVWSQAINDPQSVKFYGAVGDGVADDSTAFNTAISAVKDTELRIPPGTYLLNSDVTITAKGTTPSTSGGFALRGHNAILTGSGKLILSGVKRVIVGGVDMPAKIVCFRGVWWTKIENCRFRQLLINDATGSGFSSNFWNSFSNCQFQNVQVSSASTQTSNAFRFSDCVMRGDAAQAFTTTFSYAFDFLANINSQKWAFTGGDISYHTTAIYNIDVANSADVELTFTDTYFDSNVPVLTNRAKTLISTINCHQSNASGTGGTFSAAAKGTVGMWSNSRILSSIPMAVGNLIPNGDFRFGATSFLNGGSGNGATITSLTGAFSGRYLQLNQTNTGTNYVEFRTSALAVQSVVSGAIILKNADAGSKAIRLQFGTVLMNITIDDTDWYYAQLTDTAAVSAGATTKIFVFTPDASAFNVYVGYVGMCYGTQSALLLPSYPMKDIYTTATWDPVSIAAGASTTTSVTVTGATVGDFVEVSANTGSNLGTMLLKGWVTAADTVQLYLYNTTGGAIDVASVTFNIRVRQRAF